MAKRAPCSFGAKQPKNLYVLYGRYRFDSCTPPTEAVRGFARQALLQLGDGQQRCFAFFVGFVYGSVAFGTRAGS